VAAAAAEAAVGDEATALDLGRCSC